MNESAVIELLPVERMALTIAKAQAERGDDVPPNTAALLILAIERLVGIRDWTEDAQ